MGVLDGIKILELARVAPAEMPGMILGDMGADVLKIDTPEPDREHDELAIRRTIYTFVNRNKRSMTLNLKSPEGQAVFRKLAADADVHRRGLPPRRDEAARRRLRDDPRAEPADRLLLALRLRPGRAVPELSGPRHELPVAGRRARPHRRRGPQEAGHPAQPRGRLRGRQPARRARHRAGPVRARAHRPRPARRRLVPRHHAVAARGDAEHALLLLRRCRRRGGARASSAAPIRTTRSTRRATASS